jgi:three-Cys-motif partner protein
MPLREQANKITIDWKVIETAGKMRSIEIFYNFMIMDANMNVLWHNPDRVSAVQSARMDAAWGDHSWREIAYPKVRGLFGDMEKKTDNKTIAAAFRDRLRRVAGFKFVPEPIPMRNDADSSSERFAKPKFPPRRSGYTLSIFRKNDDGKWVLFRDANLLAAES